MFVSPAVAGDTVIIGSCSGTLYALERTTGQPIWLYDTKMDGSSANFHGEPLLHGSRVIIPTDSDPKGHLYSFDIASGELRWKLPFSYGVATSPLLAGDRVIAVSSEGEVIAVEPKSGEVVWMEAPAGVLQANPFIPSPAHAAKRVFIADNVDEVFALDAATGATVWRTTLAGRPNTSLVVVGNSLVVGTVDGYLHWIAIDSGKVKKRMRLDGMPIGTPILAAPLLFVLTTGAKGNLLALDAETGALRWKQETPKEWTTYRPLLTGSNVIVGSTEKNLCAFDRNTGELRWCRSVGQVPRGLGISDDGILYAGSLSGVVQAFRIPR
ncbi:MAG TPA: PQQ-binding-like beta-propeller repeat protein [Thermoanaerobaculia bacterium]|nr:PQQ-binding-like beta-propeller repeat protein [Thermoanaerobaculia bacterium]